MLDIRLDPQGTERLIAGLRRVSEVSTARRLIQAASRDALQPVAKQARVLVPHAGRDAELALLEEEV